MFAKVITGHHEGKTNAKFNDNPSCSCHKICLSSDDHECMYKQKKKSVLPGLRTLQRTAQHKSHMLTYIRQGDRQGGGHIAHHPLNGPLILTKQEVSWQHYQGTIQTKTH